MAQHEIHFSLKRHLETVIGVPVVWVYDGVVLPTTKPFITIEQMQNNNAILSKGRESIETIHRFQIGLYASNSTERARMQDRIKRTFLFDQIALIDTEVSATHVAGYFYAEVTGEVPMPAEDTASKTDYHKVYFDVEVPFVYGKNSNI